MASVFNTQPLRPTNERLEDITTDNHTSEMTLPLAIVIGVAIGYAVIESTLHYAANAGRRIAKSAGVDFEPEDYKHYRTTTSR